MMGMGAYKDTAPSKTRSFATGEPFCIWKMKADFAEMREAGNAMRHLCYLWAYLPVMLTLESCEPHGGSLHAFGATSMHSIQG